MNTAELASRWHRGAQLWTWAPASEHPRLPNRLHRLRAQRRMSTRPATSRSPRAIRRRGTPPRRSRIRIRSLRRRNSPSTAADRGGASRRVAVSRRAELQFGRQASRGGRLRRSSRLYYDECSVVSPERGNNSVVECDLAKVEVAGSNPVSRSNLRSRLQAKVGRPTSHTVHDHATLSPHVARPVQSHPTTGRSLPRGAVAKR